MNKSNNSKKDDINENEKSKEYDFDIDDESELLIGKKRGNDDNMENEFSQINENELRKALIELDATLTTAAKKVLFTNLLKEVGLVKKELDGVKVLGNGTLTKKLTVQANKFSKSAIVKIEESGSKIEVI